MTNDNDPNQLRIVVQWLSRLAAICRHADDQILTDQKLSDLALLLAGDFASSDFTTESLGVVARGNPWFPPYDSIRERLVEAKRERLPVRLALPAPVGAVRLTAMDHAWIAYWHKHLPDRRAQEERLGTALLATLDATQHPVAHLANLIRAQASAAWDAIIDAENTPDWRHAL